MTCFGIKNEKIIICLDSLTAVKNWVDAFAYFGKCSFRA